MATAIHPDDMRGIPAPIRVGAIFVTGGAVGHIAAALLAAIAIPAVVVAPTEHAKRERGEAQGFRRLPASRVAISSMNMKILTALDRSEYAEIVLEHGIDQTVRQAGAELHVATALPDRRDHDVVRARLERMTREALDAFGQAGHPFHMHVVTGRPAPAICALAQTLDADLLVVGRFHVPSEGDTFAWLAPCPTLIIGPDGIELDAQCRDCEEVRRTTHAEQLFCSRHTTDRLPDLVTRLPVTRIDRPWLL